MSAIELQALLRFLSQDAKVPLATAMSKVKELQAKDLGTAESIAKAKIDQIKIVFPEDEKIAKQVLAAAKRVSKKRAAGDDTASPAKKKRKDGSLFTQTNEMTSAQLEESLALPSSNSSAEELEAVVVYSNRAPLALAFVFTLLKYTMPEQPLSSRLSLAQGYISVTSKARALYLGIEKGRSAEAEGFGEGQPVVTVAGKEVRVLRRWGYEWKDDKKDNDQSDTEPPLWALDLEALKKSNTLDSAPAVGKAGGTTGLTTNMPIHTPQAARAYLLRAFDAPPDEFAKKIAPAARSVAKERNLGLLLRTLELLYESWATILSAQDLDKRTWGWYSRVRPDVAEGAQGWGGKNVVKLRDVLALRRVADDT